MDSPFDHSAALSHLSRADGVLPRLIAICRPFEAQVEPLSSPFEGLMRAIVYQQLSGKAAGTIYQRVKQLFPRRRRLNPQDILDTPDDLLRAAGLSWAKIAAANDLATKTLDKTVPSMAKLKRMNDDEIIERLTQVRGIGRWSAEMLLIFRLGRPNVLPVDDLGVRRGMQLSYGLTELPTKQEVTARAEPWQPYCTVGSWYMWRATELAEDELSQVQAKPGPKQPSRKPRKIKKPRN